MELFGFLPTGEEIFKFKLKSDTAEAEIISLGAAIARFRPFGRDIVCGFATLDEYLLNGSFHGATVGRVCNRTVGASFAMDGVKYELTKNNGEHCLHGGADNFSKKAWDVLGYDDHSVRLGYTSPDGQSGFPGEVRVTAEYHLEGAALTVRYTAVPNKKTPIMITNHAYFHLGEFGTEVTDYTLRVYADEFSEVSDKRLPTGRHISVEGTPVDFRAPRRIGERMADSPIGYDHNFILSPTDFRESLGRRVGLAAVVEGEGLRLKAYTDQPGMQLYVPRIPVKTPMFNGREQISYGAFCLESQIEPNAPGVGLGFIDAGEKYVSTTVYEAEIAD
ncbi:MAG: galactose mutarotase [Clostridia bacterium]|nr:galactose mutarotase [Clostridia bacterium]